MGAPSLSEKYWLGGRWSAAFSLWTYFHRLLHMLGILAIDREERSLLEGHAVRIRHERTGRYLAHSASLTRAGRSDALSLSSTTSEPDDVDSLFFVHFTPPDDTDDEDTPTDILRLATARPPRAWLATPQSEGPLVLAHSRSSSARFCAISDGPHAIALRIQPVGVSAGSSARSHLSATLDREGTVGVSTGPISAQTRFAMNVVPLLESSILHVAASNGDDDPTVASVLSKPRAIPVRLQSCTRSGSFLAVLPGERVRLAKVDDAGWDVFTLEYDVRTQTALIRDSQGTPLRFTEDFSGISSAENSDTGERFTVEEVERNEGGGDDRVTIRSRKGYVSIRRGQVFLERERKPSRSECFWLRLALPSMADMSKPIRRLKRLSNGVRVVEASVEVPVDAKLGYEVITDYEGFSRFVEDAAESEIVERHAENHLSVRMVQSHSFLMLTLNLGMTLDVRESPQEKVVHMEMTKGFGVREYKGKWKSTAKDDGRCILSCELQTAPALPAPAFLIDGVIMHATCATLVQLRVESVRRAAARTDKRRGVARS